MHLSSYLISQFSQMCIYRVYRVLECVFVRMCVHVCVCMYSVCVCIVCVHTCVCVCVFL